MSEGSKERSLTDAIQDLSKTVDKTVKYIRGQRAQNKTQRATIQNHEAKMVQQMVDLIKSKRDEAIATQYLPFADTVYNYTHFLQENEYNKKDREIRIRRAEEQKALKAAYTSRQLDSCSKEPQSKKASQLLSEASQPKTELQPTEDSLKQLQKQEILATYYREKSKEEVKRKDDARKLANKQKEEDLKKQKELEEAKRAADALAAEKLKHAETTRIEAEARALAEAEAARVKAEEEAIAEARALAEAEERERAEAERLELERHRKNEETVPSNPELTQQVLQLLRYFACPWGSVPGDKYNSNAPYKWGEGILNIPEEGNRYAWYTEKFKPALFEARKYYNDNSPVKSFLLIAWNNTKPDLTSFDEKMVYANPIGGITIKKGKPTSNIQMLSIRGNHLPQYPTQYPTQNNFTIVSKGDAAQNFRSVLPIILTPEGIVMPERSYHVFGPSGSGKTTQIKMLIQQICGNDVVDFFVIELYGLKDDAPSPELYMFCLDKESSKTQVQPDSTDLPRCYYEDDQGKTQVTKYTLLDKTKDIHRQELYRKGNRENIQRTMNTGIFKITPNNKESSRGLMFIHIRTKQGEYYLCDFPGSEVISEHAELNEEEDSKKAASRAPASKGPKPNLLRESKFFEYLLVFFKRVFLEKKNGKLNDIILTELENPLQRKLSDNETPNTLLRHVLHKWFIEHNLAMIFTALGNYPNNEPDTELQKIKNTYNYIRAKQLIEFFKLIDAKEYPCVPLEEASDYFGAANVNHPIVTQLIIPPKKAAAEKAAAAEGGSKTTRKKGGRNLIKTRTKR
jgi:chemotaxis protein histidine kinase CheA